MATRKLAVGWRVARTVESKSLDVEEEFAPSVSLFRARYPLIDLGSALLPVCVSVCA